MLLRKPWHQVASAMSHLTLARAPSQHLHRHYSKCGRRHLLPGAGPQVCHRLPPTRVRTRRNRGLDTQIPHQIAASHRGARQPCPTHMPRLCRPGS